MHTRSHLTSRRMSLIVQLPGSSNILLLTKGADTAILPYCQRPDNAAVVAAVTTHITSYAQAGFRTLCFATRQLTQSEFEGWLANYNSAILAVTGKDLLMSSLAEKLERDLVLQGCTAIEDRLSPGVPEAIRLLREAGIIVWVLTGDKQVRAL